MFSPSPVALTLKHSVARLFEESVVVEASKIATVVGYVFPEEEAYVGSAVPRRRAEFLAARVCARQALAKLSVPPVSLVPFSDRAPSWPAGITGSITHDRDVVAVAVARSSAMAGVGLDVDVWEPLPRELHTIVCTVNELRWMSSIPEAWRGYVGKVVFSAKEAAYKCQYCVTRSALDFGDIEIDIGPAARTFSARIVAGQHVAVRRPLTVFGRWGVVDGRVVVGAGLKSLKPSDLPSNSTEVFGGAAL